MLTDSHSSNVKCHQKWNNVDLMCRWPSGIEVLLLSAGGRLFWLGHNNSESVTQVPHVFGMQTEGWLLLAELKLVILHDA